MPRTQTPYPAEYRQQILELAHAGRSAEDLAREYEPTTQGMFLLQFPLAWFSSSPSHIPVVGERYHAFRFQTTWPAFALHCVVII